ncbi:3412_t:CDS:2, partial [Funneliformis caledonium]
WKFGKENEQKILKVKAVKEKELRDLRRKTPQQMWIEDLDCFIESWDNILSQKQFITMEVQVKPAETIAISPKSKKRSLSIDESSDDKVGKKRPLLIESVDDAREKRRSLSIDESFDNEELCEDIEEVKNVISTPVIVDDDEYVESEEVSERPKKRPRRSTAKQINYVELSDGKKNLVIL